MDATELLATQHAELMHLFEKLEAHPEKNAKRSIFKQILKDLAAHTAIEQQVLYPAAYATKEDCLRRDVDEHSVLQRLALQLSKMNADEPSFDAALKLLHGKLRRHVQREESELFPALRQRMNALVLEKLGARMNTLFSEKLSEDPIRQLLEQLEDASMHH